MELYCYSHPDPDVQVVATNDIRDHLVTLVEFDDRRRRRGFGIAGVCGRQITDQV